MTSRRDTPVSALPVDSTLETYDDGTVWIVLRTNAGQVTETTNRVRLSDWAKVQAAIDEERRDWINEATNRILIHRADPNVKIGPNPDALRRWIWELAEKLYDDIVAPIRADPMEEDVARYLICLETACEAEGIGAVPTVMGRRGDAGDNALLVELVRIPDHETLKAIMAAAYRSAGVGVADEIAVP